MKDIKNLPSMPFIVDRYLGDTRHLTLEEHGAYLLLLCEMWRNAAFIDDDDLSNARILGVQPDDWQRLKLRLTPLLIFGNGKITQKRLQLQWNYAQENRLRQSEKGKAGAVAKAERAAVLKSIRGVSTGKSSVDEKSEKPSAEIKHPYKKIIPIPSSDSITVKGDEELPEIPHHLLRTNLMKRSA